MRHVERRDGDRVVGGGDSTLRTLSAAAQRDAISFAAPFFAAFTTQRVSSRVSERRRCALPISLRKPRDIRACATARRGAALAATRFQARWHSAFSNLYDTDLLDPARARSPVHRSARRQYAPTARRAAFETNGGSCAVVASHRAQPSPARRSPRAERDHPCGARTRSCATPRDRRACEPSRRQARPSPEDCSDENALRPASARWRPATSSAPVTLHRRSGPDPRTPLCPPDLTAFTPFARRALHRPAAAAAFRPAPRSDAGLATRPSRLGPRGSRRGAPVCTKS
jgi:hypothetical protein